MPETKNEPVRRTVEIEEVTNLYLYVPLSHWLVPKLAFLNITPNMVSLSGMVCGLAAGLSYYHYTDYRFALLGFLMMSIFHVLDGADGALARMTNSQSEFGKVIDGFCDYVTYLVVYIALALAMTPSYGPGIWYLVIGAGICHAFQAGTYELQRQEYDFWGYGKKSAELPELTRLSDLPGDLSLLRKFAAKMGILYARMQYCFSGLDLNFRPRLKKFMAENPDKIDQFRADYRREFAPIVKRWAIMCPNYRTYAIFIACIIQQPIIYFIIEITVMNLILFILVQKQKKYNQAFLKKINA